MEDIIDEIEEKLAQAWCDCDCCFPDEEGFGSFTILASGSVVEEDAEYLGMVNEVQLDHVIVGHAFVEPYQKSGGATVASIFPGPPAGSLNYVWEIRIEVFDTETNQWIGAGVGSICGCGGGPQCGGFGIAEIPFRVFAREFNASPERYPNFRLYIVDGGTMDLCGDCTENPIPHCNGGGGG